MKKLLLFLLVLSNLFLNAQQIKGIFGEDNWMQSWANFKAKTTDYRSSNIILNGNIKVNTTLTADNVYLLMGTVRVTNNAILTIDPGTIIRGDTEDIGSLMICKGSKIFAKGTESLPIIFTSNKTASDRKAGDWGGLILLGNATLNTHGDKAFFGYDKNLTYNEYGGKDDNDNSGSLEYVRVEFGGKKDPTGYSSNGISLAGVGDKTTLENIMVSYSADDSIEVYGGVTSLYNVISYRSNDDDFDFTKGAQSTIYNSLAIRHPFVSDVLKSRCFEIESYDDVKNFDATKKKTLVKIKNVSLIDIPVEEIGLPKEAVYLNKEAELEIDNCIVTGFNTFVVFDNYYLDNENFKYIRINDCIIDNCLTFFSKINFTEGSEFNEDLTAVNKWFLNPLKANIISKNGYNNLFIEGDLKKQPDFRLKQ